MMTVTNRLINKKTSTNMFWNDVLMFPRPKNLCGEISVISIYGSQMWVKNCDFNQNRMFCCSFLVVVWGLSLCFDKKHWNGLPEYTE